MALVYENVKSMLQVPRLKILVAGDPGSGKTRWPSTAPNVLYADMNKGLMSVRDRDVHGVSINSVAELSELKHALDQKPAVREQRMGFRVDTIVLDTCDDLARMIMKERLVAERHDVMQVQDWGHLADLMRNIVIGFRNLDDLNVIFNVHLKEQTDGESGRVTFRPQIQGSMGDEIAAYVDIAAVLEARPVIDPQTKERHLVRVLRTTPDAQFQWVKDRTGSLPGEFLINFEDDYERLAELIFPSLNTEGALEAVAERQTLVEKAEEQKAEEERKAAAEAAKPMKVPAKRTRKKAPEPEKKPEPTPQPEEVATVVAEEVILEEVAALEEVAEPLPTVVDEPGLAFPEAIAEVEVEVADSDSDSDSEAEAGAEWGSCSVCGKPVESNDYADLSMIRYRVLLCREHFNEKKTAKR